MSIALLSFAVFALAQKTPDRVPFAPASLVAVRSGVPLTAEQSETMTKQSSGGKTTDTLKSKVYRDSFGRIRQESYTKDSPYPIMVSILDPVDGSRITIDPQMKAAQRLRAAHLGPVTPGALVAEKGALPKFEPLSQNSIFGITFVGIRISVPAIYGQPGSGISERWESSETGLTSKVQTTTSTWSYLAEITNLQRGEPDSSLFKVPVEYAITEISPTTR